MQIVTVKFLDPTTFGFWAHQDEVKTQRIRSCWAVGILVKESVEALTIALLTSEDGEDFSSWVNIPRISVQEVKAIGELQCE